MRIAAFVIALTALLLAACGGDVPDIAPAGIGSAEPDQPAAD
jgi:hypothetical protein